MLKVLAHRRPEPPFGLPFFFPPPSILYSVILISAIFLPHASGQTLLNGQLFTNGLSIVDAPAPQSNFNFGGGITIAIELSGNGKLPQSALFPGNPNIGYDSLDLYLVSAETDTNITVSDDSVLLQQEPGSTVKHLNWPIPNCLSSGEYNLTLYEGSHVKGQSFYTITPIPIEISNNPNPSGPCTSGTNSLQDQPQASSPLPHSLFLHGDSNPGGGPANPGDGQPDPGQPSAPTSSGFVTSVYPSSVPGIRTITRGAGNQISSFNPYRYTYSSDSQTVTVTESPTPTTLTLVIISSETLTSTEPGQTTYTTTETSSTTMTTFIEGPSGSDNSGFLPVNAPENAGFSNRSISISWLTGFWIVMSLIGCW